MCLGMHFQSLIEKERPSVDEVGPIPQAGAQVESERENELRQAVLLDYKYNEARHLGL